MSNIRRALALEPPKPVMGMGLGAWRGRIGVVVPPFISVSSWFSLFKFCVFICVFIVPFFIIIFLIPSFIFLLLL